MPYRDTNTTVNVGVGDVFTRMFGGRKPITECLLLPCAEEFLEHPDRLDMDTQYYRFLEDSLKTYGVVFNWYKDKDGIIERTAKYRALVYSIRDNGYLPEMNATTEVNGKPYGKLYAVPAYMGYDLHDGHHRICAMIAVGMTNFTLDLLEHT